MKLPDGLWSPLSIAALAVLAVLGWLREPPPPPPTPEAELRTEALVERLQEDGWVVLRAHEVGHLTAEMRKARDSVDVLGLLHLEAATQAALLGAELRVVSNVLAEARAELAMAAERDTVTTEEGRRVRAWSTFDDGLFSGEVAYLFEPVDSFTVQLRAMVAAALQVSEGADGSMLFSVRATDPRVAMAVEGARWSPPPPVEYCSLRTRARWGVVGTGFGAVLGLLVR